MLEVVPIGQRGFTTTRNGQNGIDLKKITSSTSLQ